MKNLHLKRTLLLLLSVITLVSCGSSDDFNATENDEIHLYIWRAMNTFYLWQEDVPDLDDNRFTTVGQIYEAYNGFASPADMFQSILFQPGTVDRFSVIVDDYIALENAFQGINVSNGMEFGLVRYSNNASNVFGYVRYVIPGSDAATQGVTRGMIFNAVDGTQLTDTNFGGLLFGDNTNYTISLADYNSGNPSLTGTTITLNKTQIQENPVHIRTTLTDGTNKVGYLMYNQFASSFDSQLNDAFGFFQSENITDLIVDLRYNGGGSTNSALALGGMITGQFNGQLFARQDWNSKIQNNPNINQSIFIDNFTSQLSNNQSINSLNLNRVYFITTGSSASASELVMNSLAPYIEVNSVGTTTIGKVQGSITLYDSDDLTRNGDNLNPNHTWAIQPLTFTVVNSNGTNAPGGITPTVNLGEDFGNLGVLGTRSDPLLDRAMILITTGSRASFDASPFQMEEISNSQIHRPLRNNMFGNLKAPVPVLK